MDKEFAKTSNEILFVKIDNDGFNLGAQRNAVKGGQLGNAIELLKKFKDGEIVESIFAHAVSKSEIAKNGDYNLSGERYKSVNILSTNYESVKLGEICKVINGRAYKQAELLDAGKYPVLRVGNFFSNRSWYYSDLELEPDKYCLKGDLLYAWSASFGPKIWDGDKCIYHYHIWKMVPDTKRINKQYLYHVLNRETEAIKAEGGRGIAMIHITKGGIEQREIPLPPLTVQEELVKEIESYQKIIDGAKMVVENYKPKIDIDPDWEMVELGAVCTKITDGSHFSPSTTDEGYPYVTVKDLTDGVIDFEGSKKVTKQDYSELLKNGCQPALNDILFSKDGTVGKTALINFEKEFVVLSSLAIVSPDLKKTEPNYLYHVMSTDWFINKAINQKTGVAIKRIVLKTLKTISIPLPKVEIQRLVVKQIEKEQELVNANKKLIKIFEQKIKDRIAKVWGE